MEADGFKQQSAATKYIRDEDGNRIIARLICSGTAMKWADGGWINTRTGAV